MITSSSAESNLDNSNSSTTGTNNEHIKYVEDDEYDNWANNDVLSTSTENINVNVSDFIVGDEDGY